MVVFTVSELPHQVGVQLRLHDLKVEGRRHGDRVEPEKDPFFKDEMRLWAPLSTQPVACQTRHGTQSERHNGPGDTYLPVPDLPSRLWST